MLSLRGTPNRTASPIPSGVHRLVYPPAPSRSRCREHGVPAVTGVTDATNVIRPGQRVTVDGFLGIVVLDDA